jgi:hypothetical protein
MAFNFEAALLAPDRRILCLVRTIREIEKPIFKRVGGSPPAVMAAARHF